MNSLHIENFKCFQDIDIPLNNLTVMAGANGNGKSTSIQALLFLRKTIEETCNLIEGYYTTQEADLNSKISVNDGYLLSLGNSSSVINQRSNDTTIVIEIEQGSDKISTIYLANNAEAKLYLNLAKVSPTSAELLPILKKEFYYLNAERIGPRVSQNIQHFDFPHTGYQGEYTAQLIDSLNYNTYNVAEEKKHPQTKSKRLAQQVNAWLGELMPGVSIVAQRSVETLTAQIQVENHYTKGEPILATNIGFGISYVLPIIATGLIVEKGSYLIVENPEAHLHPSAQSKIGRFLAMIAQSGVNVIVETHSDHVVNGIQISAAKNEIAPELVTVNFFHQDEESPQPIVESIEVNSKGELSKWPKGFFDQTQLDFATLFKIRKG